MSKDKSDALAEAVRNLVKVFAYAQIKDEGKTERKARFLKVFGLKEQEIADLLGITQPAVNMALSKDRKKGRKDSKGSNDTTANSKESGQ
jgi:predicted XRE-type DNA-binding protein